MCQSAPVRVAAHALGGATGQANKLVAADAGEADRAGGLPRGGERAGGGDRRCVAAVADRD